MCDQDFGGFQFRGWKQELQEEKFDNHYCELASRNTGHFPVFDIPAEDTWIRKKIVGSEPLDIHQGCSELNICVPGM